MLVSTGLTTSIRRHRLNDLAYSVPVAVVDDRAGSDREVLADTQGALLDLREHPPLKRTSMQIAAQDQYQARAAAFEGTFERGRITEQDIGRRQR